MAALNFPNSPTAGQNFPADNGVIYQWDGEKWDLRVQSEDLVNLWARNAPQQELYPRNFDDTILFSNLGVDLLNSLP